MSDRPTMGVPQGKKRCLECDELVSLHHDDECPTCGEWHYSINEGGVFDGA